MVMVSSRKKSDSEDGVTEVVLSISNKDLLGTSFDIRGLLLAILPSIVQALIDYLNQQRDEVKD